jgi:hypothetical protein
MLTITTKTTIKKSQKKTLLATSAVRAKDLEARLSSRSGFFLAAG